MHTHDSTTRAATRFARTTARQNTDHQADSRRALRALATAGLLGLFAACSGGSGSGDSIDLSPPAAFSYAADSVDMRSGVTAPPNSTSYSGGAATFTVAPALPDGLVLDSANGRIFGIPTAPAPLTTYTVSARNGGGSVSTNVDIEVHASFDHANFAYALHPDLDQISIWRVDAATNTLVPAGRVQTGKVPVRATVDPLGRFLYVVCGAQESVVVHRIDPETGDLAAVQLATKDGAAFDLEIDPTGRFLYKSNLHVGTLQAFTIDASSGKLAPLGAPITIPGPSALEISDTGEALFAGTLDGQAVLHFVVDATTGLVENFAGSAFVEGPVDLYYDDAVDRLYALDFSGEAILTYTIDPASGEPQLVATTPTGGAPASITPVGDRLHVAMHSPAGVVAYDVDPITGVPLAAESVALTGNPTKIEPIGTNGDSLVALDNAALLAHVGDDTNGALAWLDRRTTLDAVTDVIVVHSPRARGVDTEALLAATSQSLELGAYRATASGLEASGPTVGIGLDPARIAVDSDGRRAVVVSRGSDQIAIFDVAQTTLALDEVSVFAAGLAPRDAALTANGTRLASLDADRVALWSLAAGATTPQLLDEASVGNAPRHLALDPADRFVFVSADETVRVFALGHDAAGLTDTGTSLSFPGGSSPAGLEVSPDGRYLIVCLEGSDRLHVAEIDPVSGALTSRSTLVTGFRSTEPTFDARGRRLVTVEPEEDRISLFDIDGNGTLTLLSRADCGSETSAVAFDRSGDNVYGAALGSNTIEILSVENSTISNTSNVTTGAGTSPRVVTPLLTWTVLP